MRPPSLRLSFLLLLTALLLFCLLLVPALLVSFVLLFVTDSRQKLKPAALFYSIAWAIDLLGNVVCSDLFNVCLIRHGGYRFGTVGETVSSVLGMNQAGDTLSKTGQALAAFLDTLDPEHCRKAAHTYHLKPHDHGCRCSLLLSKD